MATMTRLTLQLTWLLLIAIAIGVLESATLAQQFRSSVVGTDFDFITDEDPDCFLCLESKGEGYREMPDKTGPSPLIQPAFIFVAYYEDGSQVDIAVDKDFQTLAAAQKEAMRYVKRIGKLPTTLRRGIKRLVIHHGHESTTAFSDHGLIVIYSANATQRISTHDLEETLFHESVHASWDRQYAKSEAWRHAQASDDQFITHYGRKNPVGEDLAESALFAFTLVHHRERLPKEAATSIIKAIPARVRFIETLVPKDKPLTYSIGPKYACDGSGKTFQISREDYQAALQKFQKRYSTTANSDVQAKPQTRCTIDLTKVGQLKDILSNALMIEQKLDEQRVSKFLDRAEIRYQSSQSLIEATSKEFQIDETRLKQLAEKFRHVNCEHK